MTTNNQAVCRDAKSLTAALAAMHSKSWIHVNPISDKPANENSSDLTMLEAMLAIQVGPRLLMPVTLAFVN